MEMNLKQQDSGYLSPTNKIELLPIENMVELIAEDARTINNNSETARRMGLTPSGLTNAIARGTVPFKGIYNFCKDEGKPMEYYLTGSDPFNHDQFEEIIKKMMEDKVKLKMELEFVKEERDRLLLAISGQLSS